MSFHVLPAAVTNAAMAKEKWGTLSWLANHELSESVITVGRVMIYKGFSNPRHSHPSCEEVLYLLAGQLQHTVGDKTVTLNAGDTLTIPAGVFHNATSTGDVHAVMIVTYSTGQRDFLPEKAGEKE